MIQNNSINKAETYLTESRLQRIYYQMKERCFNPSHSRYHRYGGRGITICQEWLDDRDNFICWAKNNGYSDNLQIDRINNDGHYEPSNCRWVTRKENSRNTSKTTWIEFNGERKPVAELAELHGVDNNKFCPKIRGGYTVEEAVSFLTQKIVGYAETKKQKKLAKIRELKEIIDNSYCFFQLK